MPVAGHNLGGCGQKQLLNNSTLLSLHDESISCHHPSNVSYGLNQSDFTGKRAH
jgi:hypothetical protein